MDTETYFMTCHRYIELNPVRAGLAAHAAAYPWSSHAHYASGQINNLITEHASFLGLGANRAERQENFRALFLAEMDQGTLAQIRKTANAGCALGSENFLKSMEAKVGRPLHPPKRGRPEKALEDERAPDAISGKLF